ncbi:MAG: hypothetical protein APZ16_07275 [Candidatus Hadarchaeum yellowstonense]|uniref:Uncharacterized protein n=1 Tax=Hadarchaeum yellowstonense TaxID=1776334 RepID=A0A147JY24_HADYE|nr:MAG: hypothetical protein APZ16_07275 [Candidatus Hadarchaeum yellowstonense]
MPNGADVSVEFRLWGSDGKKVLAVVQVPSSDRSPLAAALLAMPELLSQLAKAGVKELGWKGFVPSGRLRPASAWLLYGEIREPDLLEARKKALEIAESAGIRLDPDPAAGRVGRLGELDIAKLLANAGNKGSDSKGSVNSSSVRSRLR